MNAPDTTTQLFDDFARACDGADALVDAIRGALPETLGPDTQHVAHGHAWYATLGASLRALQDWTVRLHGEGRLGALERAIASAGFAETLAQMVHGIAMSQDETVRPGDYGLDTQARALIDDPSVARLLKMGIASQGAFIAEEAARLDSLGDAGLDDTLAMVADEFRNFTTDRISPHAHGWHLADELVPDALVAELAALGVFGLTIPEAHGGSGMGKLAMCVVTEELSRGWIGVGSLGTRVEIAGELIVAGGTEAQQARYLPAIASGMCLPCAVFTEPNTGSDLASLTTRAVRNDKGWAITGAKTWITHASRSDLMTVLVRTRPEEPGHRGLTMLLLDKTRGKATDPFPDAGLTGSEIEVLGYRGMKEYTLAFDAVHAGPDAALGGAEGEGFRQLMATFEGARIQTAARAVGVAVDAYERARDYATERAQFGRPIAGFQRVQSKLARMVVDIACARQLTYAAARAKDEGRRCDIEAGMAKLLAARTAWSAADNAVQIHGGNGYALEYPISRILCDARILNIFEGAAEIQAEVVTRGLLRRASERANA
ncbi:acyl-CoA dehydrogenase family protein [Rhizobiaceae bacterium]|nr:acyl-CoA dehydrogenase family protein [Rhizobiaceae bacterium]